MKKINDILMTWFEQIGLADGNIILANKIGIIVGIVITALIIDLIYKKAVIPAIKKVTSNTESEWDDHLLSDELLKNIRRLLPPIALYAVGHLVFPFPPVIIYFNKFCGIYITIVMVKLICSVISSIYAFSSGHEKLKSHALKGFYQMLKLVAICIGAIIIVSTVLDKNPLAILTGLGAGTAILMLVFQDMIRSLVAGIQLLANDMLRTGDWITVPKYGADGDVMEVNLTTVKVQNWDKTIVTVPPYALVNDSFQNWRGMFDYGGRRVKRSINIDMNTVRFCTEAEMAEFRKQPWMEGFEANGKQEVNLYIFRHYIEYYLRTHPKVNPEMIMTVRQLQPTNQGMPIELYFFSAETAWIKYEHLQAEVFDHVLAMMRTFDLKVFQSPTGLDFQKLN
ncbi:MAG: mechanosensitive ion channel [Bacteroidales bacterium]|nr:mechanosensitive ion channel [Bacteroidales bacterium]